MIRINRVFRDYDYIKHFDYYLENGECIASLSVYRGGGWKITTDLKSENIRLLTLDKAMPKIIEDMSNEALNNRIKSRETVEIVDTSCIISDKIAGNLLTLESPTMF
jgi:hypothetical protein